MSAKKTAPPKPTPTIFIDAPEHADTGRAKPEAGGPLSKPPAVSGEPGEAREAAFYSEHEWNGKPIRGLTSGRWPLIISQRTAVTELPFIEALAGEEWFSEALRILYFCSTEPENWRPFRKDAIAWQEEIERWADENVPLYKRIEAETLAFKIFEEANTNRHEVAPPQKGNAGSEAGN